MKQLSIDKGTIRLGAGQCIRWTKSQQCHVLIRPQETIQLNRSAAAILGLCDGTHTREDIMREVLRVRDVSLAIDVLEFLDAARARGWIVEAKDESKR